LSRGFEGNEAFAVPLQKLLLFDAETGDAAGAAA
jgi:hypothetical protein